MSARAAFRLSAIEPDRATRDVIDQHRTVIVVDDSDDVREVLTVLLEGEGLRVLPIEDGETAMLMTRRVRPVLITLDIRLPHEDGGELLRRLKSDPETSDIPVVLVSGHSSMHELGESLGADATVAKPFDIEEMQQLVRSLVERAR